MALHRCIETVSGAEKMSQDTSLLLSPFQLLNRINPYARLHPKASAMSFSLLLQNIPLVY